MNYRILSLQFINKDGQIGKNGGLVHYHVDLVPEQEYARIQAYPDRKRVNRQRVILILVVS